MVMFLRCDFRRFRGRARCRVRAAPGVGSFSFSKCNFPRNGFSFRFLGYLLSLCLLSVFSASAHWFLGSFVSFFAVIYLSVF